MYKSLTILLLSVLMPVCAMAQAKGSSATIRKEQNRNAQEIRDTQSQINDNLSQTRTQVNALSRLNSQMQDTRDQIAALNAQIAGILQQQRQLRDSITALEGRIAELRQQGARSLRDARARRKGMTEIGLIFSAQSFTQLLKRNGYIRRLHQGATRKADELRTSVDALTQANARLEGLKARHSAALDQLAAQQQTLAQQQSQTQSLIAGLRQRNTELNTILEQKRAKARELDRRLEQAIQQEQREQERLRREREEQERLRTQREREAREREQAENNKGKQPRDKGAKEPSKPKDTAKDTPKSNGTSQPKADPKLSGSFAANKGSLLFPVKGSYTIVGKFGRNTYQDLPNIQIENSGIDIETQPGSRARAVFDGTVSSIFYMDGMQNIVMLRHGEYLTVYTNIRDLAVKKGDRVRAGQDLGVIYSDPTDGNRTVLHFEVRRETTKLNPLEWVSR